MGKQAEEFLDNKEPLNEETAQQQAETDDEITLDQEEGEPQPENAEAGPEEEVEGLEVIDRSEATQPEKSEVPKGFLNRIGKLTSKVKHAEGESSQLKEQLELERKEKEIYKTALESAREQKTVSPDEPLKPPNPDDFEDGRYDPKYEEAYETYLLAKANDTWEKRQKEQNSQTKQQVSQQQAEQVEREALIEHYKAADKLKAKDFGETEDKVIEVFGEQAFKFLVTHIPDSHKLVYYLGKNEERAQNLKEKLIKNPVRTLAEIGRLLEKIELKPKTSTAPDPDEEMEGAVGLSAYQRVEGPEGATFS